MNTNVPSKNDLQVYRKQLHVLTDRLAGGVRQLTAEATRPTGSEGTAADASAHEPTATSSEADGEVARAVLSSEGQILAEAEAALARIEDGVYGRCEGCGRAIAKARLDAVPYARKCIRCARAENETK